MDEEGIAGEHQDFWGYEFGDRISSNLGTVTLVKQYSDGGRSINTEKSGIGNNWKVLVSEPTGSKYAFAKFRPTLTPFLSEKTDDENQIVSWRALGRTLSDILFVLQYLLYEANKRKEAVEQGISQLFVLETAVAREPRFHSAGLGLSVSPLSRRYLEKLGKDTVFDRAVKGMEDHAYSDGKELVRPRHADFAVRLREYGVLHMQTLGNCACLGAMPRHFEDNEGYCLSSHNVDTVFQQFNLLVGIAHVWQMVRDGVRA